jgi:hypothetical protein
LTSNCENGLATFKDGEAVSEKYWKKKGEEVELGENPAFINPIITDFGILEGPSKVTGIG